MDLRQSQCGSEAEYRINEVLIKNRDRRGVLEVSSCTAVNGH